MTDTSCIKCFKCPNKIEKLYIRTILLQPYLSLIPSYIKTNMLYFMLIQLMLLYFNSVYHYLTHMNFGL